MYVITKCNICYIALTAKSYYTNCKRASGNTNAKDQRTSKSLGDS